MAKKAGSQTSTTISPPLPGAGVHANIPDSGWSTSWNANLATDKAALVAALKCDATYQTWTDTLGANEDRPMNCVSWYEAMAFCAWDGGYLPTEAEWNYAAAGGDQQRAYPWSNPAGSLTLDSIDLSYNCFGDGTAGCALTDLITVGAKPGGDGRWGQSNLSGNVWEWLLDWYAMTYVVACNDCANLVAATKRAIRGGSYASGEDPLRTAHRGSNDPTVHDGHFGVRCARQP